MIKRSITLGIGALVVTMILLLLVNVISYNYLAIIVTGICNGVGVAIGSYAANKHLLKRIEQGETFMRNNFQEIKQQLKSNEEKAS